MRLGIQSLFSKIKNNPKIDYYIIAIIAFLSCIPALFTFFNADDFAHLYNNSPIFSKLGLNVFSIEAQISTNLNLYRPTTNIYYYLVQKLFGLNPVAFHIIQVVFFIATVLLLIIFTRKLTKSRSIANMSALFFILNTARVEPSQWPANICDTFMVFGFLSALLLIWKSFESKKGGQSLLYALGSLLAFGFALLSKEPAIVFPVVAGMLLFVIKKINFKNIFLVAISFSPIIPYLMMRINYNNIVKNSGYQMPSFNPQNLSFYIMNLKSFILRSFGLPNLPEKVNFVIMAIIFLIIAFLLLVIIRNKKIKLPFNKYLIFGFLIIFYFLAIIPTINVPNFFDRYLYLASIPFSILFGLIVYSITKVFKPLYGYIFAITVILFMGSQFLTYSILEYDASIVAKKYVKSMGTIQSQDSIKLINVPFYLEKNYFRLWKQTALSVNQTRYILNLFYDKDVKTEDVLISTYFQNNPILYYSLQNNIFFFEEAGMGLYSNPINETPRVLEQVNLTNEGIKAQTKLEIGTYYIFLNEKQEQFIVP